MRRLRAASACSTAAERRVAEFRLSPAAQSDMDGIFDYTVRQWGMEQAVRYTQAVENACTALAKAPVQAPDCSHIRPGYRRGTVGRHFIYFRVEDYSIAVIRILHRRMDMPRHLNRAFGVTFGVRPYI